MKLGLGTVQFGQNYGVSNSQGKTPLSEVERILDLAAAHGIRVLDTAPAYGTSEEVLGQVLSSVHRFVIVTKTPKFPGTQITNQDADILESAFLDSLRKLRQSQIYGLLIHDANNLLAPGCELIVDKLLELKRRGLVQKIGFSAYTPAQVKQILAKFIVDIVQIPFSVLDQRMRLEGCFRQLKQSGIEIHARSVFLQGLLLMQPDSLPSYFAGIKTHLERYHRLIRDRGLSEVRAALGFAMNTEELDVVLCGVTSCQELVALTSEMNLPFNGDGLQDFVIEDPTILNPSRWLLK